MWQGSENASGGNYGSVLNTPRFWVCQVSAYVNVLNVSECGWIMPYGRVLNMPFTGF